MITASRTLTSLPAGTLKQIFDPTGPTARIPRRYTPRVAPSDRLGRYQITGQLGAGSMGVVLKVRDDDLCREMAAKVIRGDVDQRVLTRFIREAQVTGQLQHPNIVPTHELGVTDEGTVYFTMRQIEGSDLNTLLRPGGEEPGQTLFESLQIFVKVCDAIAFAHSKGVIHRDLKPANIMVGRFGEVQVVDWGLAREVNQPEPGETSRKLELGGGRLAGRLRRTERRRTSSTPDGLVLGTPAYMSPEQARGQVDKIDRRSDVYALGAILYQMLTLELPFDGGSLSALLDQVAEGALIVPSERTPDRHIPRELELVVRKAMARSRAKRYQDVAQLKADIEAYLEGRLLRAAEYNLLQVGQKWAARHKPAVAATLGILLTVIAALVGIAVQLRGAMRAEDNATAAKREAQSSEQRANEARRAEAAQRQKAEQGCRALKAAGLARKAEELYIRKGDRSRVVAWLTEAERLHPNHPGVLRLSGRIELDRKNWLGAKRLLDRALTLEPRDYVTHFLLYRWYAERGLGAGFKAQKHVYEAGQYGTRDSAIGLWGLGRREWCKSEDLSGTQRTRALERGVELCTQALAKRPDFTWALTMRGFCRRGLGRWKQAMADHDAVIRLSGQAFSYYNRGILHHVMQQYDKAQADYDTAIRLRPRYAKACIRRGRLHHEMKRYAKALADYDTAIRLAPRFGRAYINRGRLHHEMKRYAKAQADYDTAIRIYPRYAQAYIERGSLHAGLKRYRQAIEDWKRALLLARTAARKQRIGDLIRDVRSRIK